MNDTKLSWKRRALKAEGELESLRKINDFRVSNEMSVYRENIRMKIALDEIANSLLFVKEDCK